MSAGCVTTCAGVGGSSSVLVTLGALAEVADSCMGASDDDTGTSSRTGDSARMSSSLGDCEPAWLGSRDGARTASATGAGAGWSFGLGDGADASFDAWGGARTSSDTGDRASVSFGSGDGAGMSSGWGD